MADTHHNTKILIIQNIGISNTKYNKMVSNSTKRRETPGITGCNRYREDIYNS